ncbi:xanthine dehydrogenase family protein subunit M [Luteolibacter flavescens]|uniref:Xanthine dehydrogenase family protein subunit M n=1 Tax=Luteolibacter flavescens TaxID=1859460 RepID=A0ABT3FR26_9BACT|nr:xanthine dehydrogenase family protein subunit M [Luteolibacter flavescens]MCW1886035.1 xanthine dehydrogenase family protein subunit M [Luteolibacter flavescens]
MKPFSYHCATDAGDALSHLSGSSAAAFLAGGTNLVDLMKEDVMSPAEVVDISRLPLGGITVTDEGGLRLGALETNAATARHPEVVSRYPLLAKAILAGASPQLRNRATNGGNLLQRTRCPYFYDVQLPCNKRLPGSGCPAREGYNRNHAILGTSEHCIATHPSDMCVALSALDAVVVLEGAGSSRSIPITGFHRLPEDEPHRDTDIRADELITAIELPSKGFPENYQYLKIRDRSSYAFALVSVAAAIEIEDGMIADARIALGGVAHKPWRKEEAEALLVGGPPSALAFDKAATALLGGAEARTFNAFKIPLARAAITRALADACHLMTK